MFAVFTDGYLLATTHLPVLSGLSIGEWAGPRIVHYQWSYVVKIDRKPVYKRHTVDYMIQIVWYACSSS